MIINNIETNFKRLTPCVGIPGWYCNNKGEIRSFRKNFKNGKKLTPTISKLGYPYVHNNFNGVKKNIKVHTIIANTFLKKIDPKHVVNHKNGIKADNRLCNLEFVSVSYNIHHSYVVLGNKVSKKAWEHLVKNKEYYLSIRKKGPGHNTAKKISVGGVIYNSGSDAAKNIGCSPSLLSMAAKGRNFTSGILHGVKVFFI